jgi:proteasome lid subunit RPN8/RPN11
MTNTSRKQRLPKTPVLKFAPTAWAKLLFLRDLGETEVGGFGIAPSDDPLLIEDVQLVEQQCSMVTVEFEDESVADFFDAKIDAGLRPEQFGRVWIHTHPGDSAQPSQTDEATFARVFGRSHWSVMFIVAEGGETYARLQFNQGPQASMELDVEIDYSQRFDASDWDAWEAEYHQFVRPDGFEVGQPRWWETGDELPAAVPQAWHDAWHSYSDPEIQEMFAYEQEF